MNCSYQIIFLEGINLTHEIIISLISSFIASLILLVLGKSGKWLFSLFRQYRKDQETYNECLKVITRSMNKESLSKEKWSAYGLCKFRIDTFEAVRDRLREMGYNREAQYFDSFINNVNKGNRKIVSSANQLIPMMRDLRR